MSPCACSHMPEPQTKDLINSLPLQIPVCEGLVEFVVEGLDQGAPGGSKEKGLRTSADWSLEVGDILGIYRGFFCSTHDFNQRWKSELYSQWHPRLFNEFVYKMNVYAADIAKPDGDLHGVTHDIWMNVLQVSSLHCRCSHFGNLMFKGI